MKVKNSAMQLNKLWASVLCLFLFACNSTKHLPADQYLYTQGKIVVESDSLSKSHKKAMAEGLSGLLRPIPNSSFLGMRTKLFFYNLAGDPQKQSKTRTWLREKMGQAPVLLSQVDAPYNAAILSNRLENAGFFNVDVHFDTLDTGKRKRGLLYSIAPKERYKIKQVSYVDQGSAVDSVLSKTMRRSRLKVGEPYDLEKIKNERNRLDESVKNKGYYYFNANDIIVQVDSSVGQKQVDLFVKVKPTTTDLALHPYTIDNIFIFSDYQLSDKDYLQSLKDATPYKDFMIVDSTHRFKNEIYDRTITLDKGQLYTRKDHNLSLNRLVNLGVFKFVKNSYEISDSINHKLDAYFFLTADKPKAIRVELLGKSNSASYSGAELNINWSNKNFFKGAELFSVSAYGGADFQMSARNKGYNVFKAGVETSLTWPRLLAPWSFKPQGNYIPKTRAMLSYEFLERSKLYSLNSFGASWGYFWKSNVRKEHHLDIVEISYVTPQNVTQQYIEDSKGNPSLERVLDKQLIFGPKYTYTFTNTMNNFKKHTIYWQSTVDFAGNLTGLISGADARKDKTKNILGVPFSQYVKIEQDFRHYLKLSKHSMLVSRIHAGAGFAYGNSEFMPYSKQFYAGGPSSIRAFRARGLGPGSFDPNSYDTQFIPDQTGDMLIEMNLEYRTKLVSIVHGALFVDAGNIWNLTTVSDREGGKFSKDFLSEMAIGAGAGIRFDITFLVLRFDLAIPLRIPYYEKSERWVIKDIDFGSRQWRKDNLMLNFAIGYPF